MEKQLERIEAKIDSLTLQNAGMVKDVEQNTKDLNTHIKRTDLLEFKLQRVYIVLYVFAGIGMASVGPSFIRLLKVLL